MALASSPASSSVPEVTLTREEHGDAVHVAGNLRRAASLLTTSADRCLNGCIDENGVEMLTTPGAVCAALSSELFLKYIVLKETGNSPKGHQLDKLFAQCRKDTQDALLERRCDILEVL